MLRVKGIEDQLADVRPGPQVRHEALATYLAAGAGAAVAAVVAVGETPDDDGLLALELIEGRPLADLAEDQVTDALLHEVWAQVARLHAGRIALDRRLSTDQVLVDGDGAHGLRWSQMAATELRLAADVAELLVATAAVAGRAGRDRGGRDRVSRAAHRGPPAHPAPRPVAVDPSAGQGGQGAGHGEQVQATSGADAVELFPLERIGWGQIASAFGVVFLVLVALAFISNWGDISEALSEADWSRLPLTVVLAGLTYVAGR